MTWQSGALPVIVLAKSDLADDPTPQIRALQLTAIGVGIVVTSAVTGDGLSELMEYLKDGVTAVFLGSSGVGKSSLLNALLGREVMKVRSVRSGDAKGRHTTTHRQLVVLPNGAHIIDTPGMRELGMWSAREGISNVFSDVEIFLGSCRFSDCRHQEEPGCAIRAAIDNGIIDQDRWDSYVKLKRESLYMEDKIAALHEKIERNKSNPRWSGKREKDIW